MALCMSGLRGLAELSGSFAVAGFAAAICKPSRLAQAFYVDPALVIFKDAPYPIKKSSGNLLIEGTKVYPVDSLLRGPWTSFYPTSVAMVFAKNAGLHAVFYLQGYIQQIDRLEEEAREQAVLEGRDPDEAEDVRLPPVPLQDVERLIKAAGRSSVRECTVTHIRRRLELYLRGRVSDQLLWKCLKEVPRSAVRKANRLKRFWQVSQATFCTVQRAYILGQVAEWILSTTLDTLWLLGVPLLPLRWQLRLGGHVPQRLPIQAAVPEPVLSNSAPEEALSDTALASQQQQWQDGLDLTEQAQEPNQTPEAQQQQPTDRRDEVAQDPAQEGLCPLEPVAWKRRSRQAARRAVGNAARVSASLLASSAGAATAAAIYPAGPVVMLAANAADFALAIFLTGPELHDWYDGGKPPQLTMAIAALSLGVSILLVDKVGRKSG